MSTEVVMPQMGESIAEGTITKWLKQVGRRVEREEPLFEIATDKVDAEIPSPAAGTLTEIRFKEGDTVEINTTVAVLDGGAAAPAKAEVASQVGSPAAPAVAAPAEQPPAKPAVAAPQQAQVEASAATGAEVQPTEQAATAARSEKPEKPSEEVNDRNAQPSAVKSSSTENGRNATATAEELRRTKSSPLVRRIAEEHGVDIAGLEGTGMSGRVTKNDILSFIESGSPAAAGARAGSAAARPATAPGSATQPALAPPSLKPAEGDRVEQMSVMRQKIAEDMVQSRGTSG